MADSSSEVENQTLILLLFIVHDHKKAHAARLIGHHVTHFLSNVSLTVSHEHLNISIAIPTFSHENLNITVNISISVLTYFFSREYKNINIRKRAPTFSHENENRNICEPILYYYNTTTPLCFFLIKNELAKGPRLQGPTTKGYRRLL